MKKIIILSAIIFASLACNAFEYKIYGTIDSVVPDRVVPKVGYIRNYDGEVLATAPVLNRRFEFKGETENQEFVILDLGRLRGFCILDSIPVEVGGYPLFPKSPTGINKQYEQLRNFKKGLKFSDIANHYGAVINGHPDIAIGLAAAHCALQSNMLELDDWDLFYSYLTPEMKNLQRFKMENEKYEKMRRTAPGNKFVDFSAKSPDGSSVSLSDYAGKGKFILLDFWASWCGFCHQEAREVLIPLYERLKDRSDFEIIGVAVNDKLEDTLSMLEKEAYPWKQMIDAGKVPMELYGFNALPNIILISPDGTILSRTLRGENLVSAVEKALDL